MTTERPSPVTADWRDDPANDERWSEGCDFAMEQLCAFLGVDPKAVSWDAATETVDGDVQAIIGNILRAKFGEDWGPNGAPAQLPASPASDGLRTFDTTGTMFRRAGNILAITCENAEIANRVADQLRTPAQQTSWRTDFENAPSPCIGWCSPPAGDDVRQIWRHSHLKGQWSAHGVTQTVKAWQPLPSIAALPSTPSAPGGQPKLTRTQFIVQIILAYADIYPDISAERAMADAARTYKDFVQNEKTEFGDPKFAWDASAARTIVKEYEGVDATTVTSTDGGGK